MYSATSLTVLFLIGLFCLGAVVASFVGVLAERLYTGQRWARDRSRCNSCRAELAARDLVPVLSWLASAGRCRRCGSRIPAQYAIAEAVLGSLFAGAGYVLGPTFALAAFLLALSILAFVVLYDLRHMIVPRGASTLLLAACALFGWLSAPDARAFGLSLMVAGAVALFFFALYAASLGRAMGLGDAPVALALALLAGPRAITGLLFSFWIGALFGIALLLVRRGGPRMGIEVPFVPFLAAGYLLAFFTTWNPLALALG